jgi:hypothetical protein
MILKIRCTECDTITDIEYDPALDYEVRLSPCEVCLDQLENSAYDDGFNEGSKGAREEAEAEMERILDDEKERAYEAGIEEGQISGSYNTIDDIIGRCEDIFDYHGNDVAYGLDEMIEDLKEEMKDLEKR